MIAVSPCGTCLVDNVLFIHNITTGSESDADDEDEPVLDTVHVLHDGGVNRIRVCIFNKIICICIISVAIWYIKQQLINLSTPINL